MIVDIECPRCRGEGWFQEAANKADYEKAMAEEDADIPNMFSLD